MKEVCHYHLLLLVIYIPLNNDLEIEFQHVTFSNLQILKIPFGILKGKASRNFWKIMEGTSWN